MVRDGLKLAAYLDEAGEEPVSGCKTLAANNIHYLVLRHCWTGNVCGISDAGHQKLASIIRDQDLTVICIASELGKIEANQLSRISDDQINRVLDICSYYRAPMVRIYIGNKNSNTTNNDIENWMGRVEELCLTANVTPLLEVTAESHLHKAPDVAKLLSTYKHWKLIYDPVQFILRQNQDPFVRYWTLLKSRVGAIDIRDVKIGRGFKPPGFGDAKIDLTIKDSLDSNYKGWFFMEPSLGRRHAHARTKKDTFQFALESLDVILDGFNQN